MEKTYRYFLITCDIPIKHGTATLSGGIYSYGFPSQEKINQDMIANLKKTEQDIEIKGSPTIKWLAEITRNDYIDFYNLPESFDPEKKDSNG